MSNQNQGESRFESVRKRIRAALLRVGRDESELTLIGASKLQSPETVAVALSAGLGCLGENYVQEAGQKHAAIRALARSEGFAIPRWHMIGALQRNKTKRAVSLFDVIQTVDRSTLAREIDKCAAAQGKTVDVYLQVNLSRESQKAGVDEDQLPALLEYCVGLSALRVAGLMTIPAPVADPEENRLTFARLRDWRERLHTAPGGQDLRDLSMGMSRDFEIAIEEGATVVRIGSELFGPRPAKGPTPTGNQKEDAA